jgi:hypothetical protein
VQILIVVKTIQNVEKNRKKISANFFSPQIQTTGEVIERIRESDVQTYVAKDCEKARVLRINTADGSVNASRHAGRKGKVVEQNRKQKTLVLKLRDDDDRSYEREFSFDEVCQCA